MWHSLGDNYDISKHDDTKHKRKIRTTTLALILVVTSSFAPMVMDIVSDFNMTQEDKYKIAMWISIASAILMPILMLIKYLVNDEEVDRSLLFNMLLLIILIILYSNF